MSKANRFTSFADPEEVQAQAQAQAAQAKKAPSKDAGKKVVVKKAAPVKDSEEFESVTNKPQAAQRGGRGGRGERGGRGGERGGRGRGGERGGRGGRGGRPRTAATGEDGEARVERAERGGHRSRFEGKAREDAHPMDRQDGTGRGRRGDRKGGNQKGGWGGKKPAADETVEKTEDAPVEEKKVAAEPVVVEEEEEEVGFTLDDYMAEKAAKSKGLVGDNAAKKRSHEKIQDKVQENERTKVRVTTIDKPLKSADVHAMRPDANAALFGFQAPVDVDFDDSKRGGRGGARGGRGAREAREPRQTGGRRGGRGGGKLVINDDAFPAL